jgi:hypothetical protein
MNSRAKCHNLPEEFDDTSSQADKCSNEKNRNVRNNNNERRLGVDRRNSLYMVYIPERRSGRDRRKNFKDHESNDDDA